MKRFLFFLCCLMLVELCISQIFDAPAFYIPQKEPFFSRGFGFGARAMGMGGAFIAVGDDSTASSWNPAGLARMMTMEFGLVSRYWRSETTEVPTLMEISGAGELNSKTESPISNYSDSSNISSIDLLSFAMPVSISGKKIFSVQFSYQRNYKFPGEREISYFTEKWEKTGGAEPYKLNNVQTNIKDTQNGGLDSLTFSIAKTIGRKFHIGISGNYWMGKEEREIMLHQEGKLLRAENEYSYNRNLEISYDGKYTGFSFNIGLLYDLSDSLSVGLVYKPKFKVDFERSNQYLSDKANAGNYTFTSLESLVNQDEFFKDGEIEWPEQYGFGIAIHPNPKLTIAFDFGSTLWSKSSFENGPFPINYSFTMNIPYYGIVDMKAKDSMTYRFGLENLIGTKNFIFALRGGAFYEKNLMVSPFYSQPSGVGFSLGGGLLYKNLLIDTAIVYDTIKIDYKDGYAKWESTLGQGIAKFDWEGNQKSYNIQFLLSAFYRF